MPMIVAEIQEWASEQYGTAAEGHPVQVTAMSACCGGTSCSCDDSSCCCDDAACCGEGVSSNAKGALTVYSA